MKKYSLFAARHEMPENSGPLFEYYDFNRFSGEKNAGCWFGALEEITKTGGCVLLYVTGLTPALTEFLAAVASEDRGGTLCLMHWDKEASQYRPQVFCGNLVVSNSLSVIHYHPKGSIMLWSMIRGGILHPTGEYCTACGRDPGNGSGGYSHCCGAAIEPGPLRTSEDYCKEYGVALLYV